MGNISTPKIRFPDLKGEWINNSLGEIANFSKGKGISKEDISETGETECIRYGELYTTYNETIDTVFSKTNIDTSHLVLSEANDVIIPASGETEVDIAKASCILKSGIALGGDLNIIKTLNNGVFLSYYLNSKKKIDIAKLAQGISVVHLYAGQLSKLQLKIPSLPEQKKIASFFTAIDQKISQLKLKKTLLEQYKKGVMQKIFSQQIRFKDDNGQGFPKWEKKRLGEVSERNQSKNKTNAETKVLTNSAINGIVLQSDYFDKDIANQNNLLNYYIVEVDDFVYNPRISVHAPVGPIKRNHIGVGVMSPLYSVFRITKGILDFFELYFSTTHWHEYMKGIANYGARSDRMNITTKDLYNMPIPFPALPEQTKIANFLSAIDDKINHTQSQIEKAEVWKKGLMQQMFV